MFLHSIMVTVAKIAEFLPYPNLGTHQLQSTGYGLYFSASGVASRYLDSGEQIFWPVPFMNADNCYVYGMAYWQLRCLLCPQHRLFPCMQPEPAQT